MIEILDKKGQMDKIITIVMICLNNYDCFNGMTCFTNDTSRGLGNFGAMETLESIIWGS
jgi:hypothetical protein